MATPLQRTKAILDALHDGDTDNARITRVLEAFAYTRRRGETLTNTQKAQVFIAVVRQVVRQVTLDAEQSQVAATAVAGVADIDLGTDA